MVGRHEKVNAQLWDARLQTWRPLLPFGDLDLPYSTDWAVNLGTLTGEQPAAMREAVAAAVEFGTPWVLDPVAVGALPVRTPLASELITGQPTLVRGNAS